MEERKWRRGSGGEEVEERKWKRGSEGEAVEERKWRRGSAGEEVEERKWDGAAVQSLRGPDNLSLRGLWQNTGRG